MMDLWQIALCAHTPAMRGDCDAAASEVAFSKADCNCSWSNKTTTQVQHQQNKTEFVPNFNALAGH